MTEMLTGRTAIVTGAGRGLGAAVARELATIGCRVALLDLNESAIAGVIADISDQATADGERHLALIADVSSEHAVDGAVRHTLDSFGRIDFLVNCAGIDYTLAVDEITVDQWDRVLGVNLRGPFLTTRAVFPHMRNQNGGHIVNIASTAGVRAWPNASAYCAAKWGLIGFTRAVGTEGRPYNIRTTTVIPGGMQTGFFDRPDLPIKPDPANLNDPRNVARAIGFVLAQPETSVVQELCLTPLTETSWP